jgi:regulator of replication initiation timing
MLGLSIKGTYINAANQQLASHQITKEAFSQILQFISSKKIYDAVQVISEVAVLLLLIQYALMKSTHLNFVQDVVLPRAVEFSTALRKIGVLFPKEQMDFVKKHKLPIYIAKTSIIGDESQNTKAKLYPFSRGIMASPAVYSQNIGKRMLCLNGEDYQLFLDERLRQTSIANDIRLEAYKQEIAALTSTLKTEMDKNSALQKENDELKMQMKTLRARMGKATVAVQEAMVFARVAIPLIDRLKKEFQGHKYTRPDIQSAFLADVEQQQDLRPSLQKIFESEELILPEAYMKAIRNELSGLVSTGGRSPLKNNS